MNKQLDTCFDRVEKALGTLIDSIAKYNPSTSQVQELGHADAELTKGLKDLQTHQTNHQRIQALRASTAAYDAQIRDTLRLLAATRKELVDASATAFPDDGGSVSHHEIRYDELLSYARRISKTTIPPVGALNAISALEKAEAAGQGGAGAGIGLGIGGGEAVSAPETAVTTPAGGTPNGNGATTNGAATPQPNGIADTPGAITTTTTTVVAGTGAASDLPSPLAMFLNPHSAYTFVPWPSEQQVRHGAIASLAYMAEQGIEAEGYDPEVEKARKEAEEEERKGQEEKERLEREERDRRIREDQARARAEREKAREKEQAEAWRRTSVSAGAAGVGGAGVGAGAGAGAGAPPVASPVQQKAQFQFMEDDDDDDD
ncbi:vitamin-D-receptor interacting mediator subunit 4-domain-containing protein [Astrocystis sublimbata]|nr:vitamin-D-receptor interacting mediator subunit 4-domain-containing protein [Astrocystis sublimbata]